MVIEKLKMCNETESIRQRTPLHKDLSTTMIYPHVLNKCGHGARSPVDEL